MPRLAVDAREIAKSFAGIKAVNGISFSIPERCVCGLLGPNGAGKTTTIRMLAGILQPDSGSLTVAGCDMHSNADRARAAIGYLPESAPVHPELRAREFLAYRAAIAGLTGARAKEAIEGCAHACHIDLVMGRLVGSLSKGFRQRVGLAAAMLAMPHVLILDEPSVGLDPHQLLEFRSLLCNLGRECTVIVSSHILAEIDATCDRAILIASGSIVAQGTMEELRENGRDTYVVEVKVDRGRFDSALATIDGFTSLASTVSSDGWTKVVATGRPGLGDMRECLSEKLASCGAVVREIRRDRASLESLFVEATRR